MRPFIIIFKKSTSRGSMYAEPSTHQDTFTIYQVFVLAADSTEAEGKAQKIAETTRGLEHAAFSVYGEGEVMELGEVLA